FPRRVHDGNRFHGRLLGRERGLRRQALRAACQRADGRIVPGRTNVLRITAPATNILRAPAAIVAASGLHGERPMNAVAQPRPESPRGLSSEEAAARHLLEGPNELAEAAENVIGVALRRLL